MLDETCESAGIFDSPRVSVFSKPLWDAALDSHAGVSDYMPLLDCDYVEDLERARGTHAGSRLRAHITALESSIADGSLVPRSEVDALVAVTRRLLESEMARMAEDMVLFEWDTDLSFDGAGGILVAIQAGNCATGYDNAGRAYPEPTEVTEYRTLFGYPLIAYCEECDRAALAPFVEDAR